MSLAVSGTITPILVEDKRLAYPISGQVGVVKSGSQNTYKVLPTQNYSSSSITFNAQPPSQNIAINREVLVSFPIELTITGTAGSNGLILNPNAGYDAPRMYPGACCTNSINVSINNSTVTQNNYQVVHALFRSNVSDFNIKTDLSLAPSMPDFYQNYDDNLTNFLGVANDPLQPIGQNSYYQTRGGYPFTIVSNTDTVAVVRFESTESLILSPFLTCGDDETALIGVQSLTLTFNLLNLSRSWSHSAGAGAAATITSIVGRFYDPPQLLMNYITPPSTEPIPNSVVYNYANIDVYNTDYPTPVASNTSVTMQSQNIQLNNIPRRIYIFARRTDATTDFTTSDVFARLESISISFDNQSGILSGSNSKQLYNLSKNAGLNMNYAQWSTYTGSVLVLDVGKGLMLQNSSEAPSLATTKQFQVSAVFTNINQTEDLNLSLYIMVVSDGLITISSGTSIQQNSVLSVNDIADAKMMVNPHHVEEFITPRNFYGGSFFSKLKSFGHKVNEGLKQTKAISQIATAVGHPEVATLASRFGYGLIEGGAHSGGAHSGGRLVRKSHLRLKDN